MKKLIIFVLALIIAVTALAGCGQKQNLNTWGTGITSGIPQFPKELQSYTAAEDGSYAAAYYKNVTGEEITQYLAVLAEQGINLKSGIYPASAIKEDKIITIHYNVTEMLFSVTVTKTQQ